MASGLPIFLVDAICLLVSVAIVLVAKGWRPAFATPQRVQTAYETWLLG